MLRSKISLSVSAALLLGMVSITGCGTNNAANTGVETKSVKGMHDGRIGVNSVDGGMIRTNTADKMEMSRDLADRIAAMPEVRSANVVLLGKSAYVAVTLDEAATGPHAKSTTRYNARSYSTPNTYGTGNGPTGMMSGTGRSMTGTTPGTMGTTGTRSGTTDVMDGRGMKREIDRGIGKGMGTGMGMGTRSTTPGYNMTATEADTVTKEMKDKIAAEVKKHAPQINAVYVSANADFVQRVNVYAEEARAGHPLTGFAKEFGTMIERIFPTRSDK
ncbi:YhcN/YlaJ family sporulation lipoprotein [Paenibacillus monticola]|nr:YhcN/YlaJ family sporulation lipoprotein [Paenibacillus monticola]